MLQSKAYVLAVLVFLIRGYVSIQADERENERFLVTHRGYALLGPDGNEVERLDSITNGAGALSRDGKWVAFARAEPALPHGTLVIRSRVRPEDESIVPLVWGSTGSSLQTIWSSDSKKILICEQGWDKGGGRASAYRVYDLPEMKLNELGVPSEHWVNDWSVDGKRLLTTARPLDATRIAWINANGIGEADYITSNDEVAYSARLSSDGTRILCMFGPKPANAERVNARLWVINLSTNERTVIDEPGETHGYCWSADGSKIAYTWQPSLKEPSKVAIRETFLITCNADGTNRNTVTSRKYEVPQNSSGRNVIFFFFTILDWG